MVIILVRLAMRIEGSSKSNHNIDVGGKDVFAPPPVLNHYTEMSGYKGLMRAYIPLHV